MTAGTGEKPPVYECGLSGHFHTNCPRYRVLVWTVTVQTEARIEEVEAPEDDPTVMTELRLEHRFYIV